MNKKQEEYLLHRLAQSLSLHNPLKYDMIHHMITSEYEKLTDDEMADKRFEFKFNDGECLYFSVMDNETGKEYKYLIDDELLKLLNELHEENKRLKLDKSNLHHAMSREEVRHKQFKDKIFCQIDCKIKHLKECYMVNEAKIIEDLKEELIWNE